MFETKVKISDAINVTEAVIKNKSCNFQYKLPKNIEENQIESIQVS